MNEELNKKLAEWAGFILHGNVAEDRWWLNGNFFGKEPPNFTKSLDACFKWLVPKYISVASQLPMGLPSIIHIYGFLFNEWLKILGEEKDPALALCLAIEKLIDGEQHGNR